MSSAMRTTLQTVPESLATDHVTNSKVRLLISYYEIKNIGICNFNIGVLVNNNTFK